MKKYLCRTIFLLFFLITATVFLPYTLADAADANPVVNGSFEYGMEGWNTYFNEKYSGNGEVKDCRAVININFFLNWYDETGADNGPVNWSTQLVQKDIKVEKYTNYKLKFKASSTVKRPIKVYAGDYNEYFLLGTEEQTYEIDYYSKSSSSMDLVFMMGQFTSDEYPDYPYTTKEFEKHTIYISDVRLIGPGEEDSEWDVPRIIGAEDNKDYYTPVSLKVNYRNHPYTLELLKDGKKIDYKEGTQIWEDGSYTVTVTDKDDSSIQTVVNFTMKLNIDFNKKWVVIQNKSTEKVMEAGGSSGKSIIQMGYAGRAGQFFLIEDAGSGYYKIRSMSSGYLAGVTESGQLELSNERDTDMQLWEIDRSVPQGYVKFINKYSKEAIDVSGGSKTEGEVLSMAEKSSNDDEGQDNDDAQRWDIIYTVNAKEAIQGKQKPDVSTPAKWAVNAVVTPVVNGLNPAGNLTVEFYPLDGAGSYDIYFDGKKTASVTNSQLLSASVKDNYMVTEDGTIKLFKAAYITKVSKHTLYIQTDTGTKTNTMEFYLSKKGVGWGTLHRTADMDLSWYYHWSTDKALGTDKYLEFVPMLWGNYGDDWLKDASNKKYGTVLSFNEPDWSDQSNVPVTIQKAQQWTERYNKANNKNIERPSTIEEVWQSFMDSGLRIGSPATAIAPPYCNGSITMNDVDGPDTWWYDFMDLINSRNGWDYDFVAVHSYDGGCDAKGFLKMVDETYELTGKPIWITEFGVAEFGSKQWQGGNTATAKKVREFMAEVVEGLEERDFVERYAWFPFDPDDDYGGASGIFNYSTGELTELGKLYKSLGVPEGYDPGKRGDNGNAAPGGDEDNNKPGSGDEGNNKPGNGDVDNNTPGNNNGQDNNSIYTDRTGQLMGMLQGYFMYLAAQQNEHNKENIDAIVNYLEETKKQVEESNAKMEATLEKLQEAAFEYIKMQNSSTN